MAEIVDFGLQQHKIKMDSRYFENVLSVVAGDTGRRLEVQLLDTNGMVQNTTGLNLRLNALVADKATFTDATLVDAATGKYQLDLSNGMFLAPGNWQFQWQITDSAGKKLHSFAFTGNIGKNISEGGSQATNFYLNLEDLKAMQDDLVNGTIDSSILETNITEKLTNLETQYAPKLTEVTAQLVEKAAKSEVQSLVANKAEKTEVRLKAIPLEQTDLSDTLKQQIAGTAPINAVPADNSLTTRKLKDNIITNSKLVTPAVTINLFDQSSQVAPDIIDNSYITSEGVVSPLNGWYVSKPMAVIGASQHIIENVSATTPTATWYDKNGTWISTVNSTAAGQMIVNSPANAVTLRLSITKSNPITGVLANGYYAVQAENIKPESITQEKLDKKLTFPIVNVEGYKIGKNLFDKSKATAGGYINRTTGGITLDSNFFYSEYISVVPGTQLVKKGTYSYAFYDSNKVFISGAISGTVLTVPANAAYVRISAYKEVYTEIPGIDGEQLELGTVSTSYESFGFQLNSLKVASSQVVEGESVALNVPAKIYALVGQELNIYFDNLLSQKDSKFEYDVICAIGGQYENFFRVTPTDAGTNPFTLIVYKNDAEVARATSNIIVKAASVGNTVTKKLLIIGDSTTENDFTVPKIKENFLTDVMNIETIGTRGSIGSKHEGRAGWTTDMFMGRNVSYASPFIFNGVFDYSQYILSNSLDTPDYVTINLGINDFFAVMNDSVMQTRMNATVTDYNTMIASIKTQNPNVKIAIALTIPPNYSQDAFGVNYASGQTRKRYKRNNFLWVKKLMESFANREGENIYLLPIHLNLDTRHNFGTEQKKVNARNPKLVDYPIPVAGVHPVESGYWQIADSYWYFLKSFEI